MFGISYFSGVKFKRRDHIGLLIALSGISILFLPDSDSYINYKYAILMMLSGIAWGVYTLLGAKSKSPALDGALSFILLSPLAVCLFIFASEPLNYTGVLLAILSGSITSGLAYSLWYSIAPKIHASSLAIMQTSVPIIATVMGITFLNEVVSFNFIIASILVISGIAVKNSRIKKDNQG